MLELRRWRRNILLFQNFFWTRSTAIRIRARRCIAQRMAGRQFRRRKCCGAWPRFPTLVVDLGVQSGDRVGIFAPNCPEWHIADFAVQGIGAVVVPVYFNESPDRLVYILNDSGAKVVFACGESQGRKIAECRDRLPDARAHDLRLCAGRSATGNPPLRNAHRAQQAAQTSPSKIAAQVEEYRARAAAVAGDQLATIIYTSGTTGEPKGVMLTHENLVSNAIAFSRDFDMLPSDVALSLLPLAHVYERTIDYSYFFHGVSIAYVAQIETVPQALLEVQPDHDGRGPSPVRENICEYRRTRPPQVRPQEEALRLGAPCGVASDSVAGLSASSRPPA